MGPIESATILSEHPLRNMNFTLIFDVWEVTSWSLSIENITTKRAKLKLNFRPSKIKINILSVKNIINKAPKSGGRAGSLKSCKLRIFYTRYGWDYYQNSGLDGLCGFWVVWINTLCGLSLTIWILNLVRLYNTQIYIFMIAIEVFYLNGWRFISHTASKLYAYTSSRKKEFETAFSFHAINEMLVWFLI